MEDNIRDLIIIFSILIPSFLLCFGYILWKYSFGEQAPDAAMSSRMQHFNAAQSTRDGKAEQEEDEERYEVDEMGRMPSRPVSEAGTLRPDGTRSFMNGWFALDTSLGHSARSRRSIVSLPAPSTAAHQRLEDARPTDGAWETRSERNSIEEKV